MPQFSVASLARLQTCHPDLQRVCREGIKHVDFSILEGHRGKELQDHLFAIGQSKLKWPLGMHNQVPSRAVDVGPFPLDWKEPRRFIRVASVLQGIGFALGIPLRLGGDWDGDFLFNENFYDWPHLELL